MEYAISFSTGKEYAAYSVSYAQVQELKLLCPVCKEKVFKRVRQTPKATHMFVHHRGGSPDCELYHPAVVAGSTSEGSNQFARGQTFAQFISDIEFDIQRVLIEARLIPQTGISDNLLRSIDSALQKEHPQFAPSFAAVELANLSILTKSAASLEAERRASLINEFYTRDGARFIDAIFCKWLLGCVHSQSPNVDISFLTRRIVRNRTTLSNVAAFMLAGLALFYTGDSLDLYRDEFTAKLVEYSNPFPLCEGTNPTSWSNCIGTSTSKNGDKYVGEYQGGKRNGNGILTSRNGTKYEGLWSENRRHGVGTCTWRGGERYSGDWKSDKSSGQGTYAWVDGSEYKGGWKSDKRQGEGTYIWPDGSAYVGGWKSDMRHGDGVHTWFDGSEYRGEWNNDKCHGLGTYSWSDGTRYVGKWRNDEPTSEGIWTYPQDAEAISDLKEDDGGMLRATVQRSDRSKGVELNWAVQQVGEPISDLKEADGSELRAKAQHRAEAGQRALELDWAIQQVRGVFDSEGQARQRLAALILRMIKRQVKVEKVAARVSEYAQRFNPQVKVISRSKKKFLGIFRKEITEFFLLEGEKSRQLSLIELENWLALDSGLVKSNF